MLIDHSATRRSRRLSKKEIINYDDDGWENCDLLYPEPESILLAQPPEPSSSSSPIIPTLAPQRKSHARRRPSGHIPRPPNPFICFRTDYCIWNKQLESGGVRNHRMVSKLAGQAWKSLGAAAQQKYVDIAEEKKRQHIIKYPDYEYTPTPRPNKGKKRRAADDDCDYEQGPSKRRKGDVQPLTVGACLDTSSSDRTVSDYTPFPIWQPVLFPSSSPPSPHIQHLTTPELSPPISFGTPNPVVSMFSHGDENDFVATADIPPLDLYANSPGEKKELTPDRDVMPPSSREAFGTQFFKATATQQTREQCMWYNAAGELLIDTTMHSSLEDDSELKPINTDVQFTNPFQLSMEDLFHIDQL